MSSKRRPARAGANTGAVAKPLIGSLLRLPREHIVRRMFAELQHRGFDLSRSEMDVFVYPGPEGRRPIDLARQCNTSRQAMNYVLAGLEHRGYLVRQSEDAASSVRRIQLTEQGRQVFTQMRNTVAAIETEWKAHLGMERFNMLRDTLQQLTRFVAMLESSTAENLEARGTARALPRK